MDLSDQQVREWLEKVDNPSKFRCTPCNKTRSLSISGQSALIIHTSGTNIKKLQKKKRLNFFNKSKRKSAYKEPEQLDSSSSSSTSKQLAIYGKININEVTYVEIRWVLKIIVIGFSMNLVDDVCDTFNKMFLDSDIAARIRLGRAEATYIANFGLPYFLKLSHDSFNKPPI